ncbi:hypothetical protein [Bacillus sp. 2205SS5-2]
MNEEPQKQLKRVLEYIEHHLQEKLTLAELAKKSTYSSYYFY